MSQCTPDTTIIKKLKRTTKKNMSENAAFRMAQWHLERPKSF
jgi:hypothetical protein